MEKILKDLDLDLNNPEHGERFLPHSPYTNHKYSIFFACSFANMSEDSAKVDALIRELDQELPPEDDR
jgi:hypothetical protein